EIRDEIVPARQLHVDLSKRILVCVPPGNESVVDRDEEERDEDDDRQEDPTCHKHSPRRAARCARQAYLAPGAEKYLPETCGSPPASGAGRSPLGTRDSRFVRGCSSARATPPFAPPITSPRPHPIPCS